MSRPSEMNPFDAAAEAAARRRSMEIDRVANKQEAAVAMLENRRNKLQLRKLPLAAVVDITDSKIANVASGKEEEEEEVEGGRSSPLLVVPYDLRGDPSILNESSDYGLATSSVTSYEERRRQRRLVEFGQRSLVTVTPGTNGSGESSGGPFNDVDATRKRRHQEQVERARRAKAGGGSMGNSLINRGARILALTREKEERSKRMEKAAAARAREETSAAADSTAEPREVSIPTQLEDALTTMANDDAHYFGDAARRQFFVSYRALARESARTKDGKVPVSCVVPTTGLPMGDVTIAARRRLLEPSIVSTSAHEIVKKFHRPEKLRPVTFGNAAAAVRKAYGNEDVAALYVTAPQRMARGGLGAHLAEEKDPIMTALRAGFHMRQQQLKRTNSDSSSSLGQQANVGSLLARFAQTRNKKAQHHREITRQSSSHELKQGLKDMASCQHKEEALEAGTAAALNKMAQDEIAEIERSYEETQAHIEEIERKAADKQSSTAVAFQEQRKDSEGDTIVHSGNEEGTVDGEKEEVDDDEDAIRRQTTTKAASATIHVGDAALVLLPMGFREDDARDGSEQTTDGQQEGPSSASVGDTHQVVSARRRFLADCIDQNVQPRVSVIVRRMQSSSIQLQHQGMGNKLATIFARCLNDIPRVEHLNVCDNRLTDDGLSAIISAICDKQDALLSLDVSQNKVDGNAAEALAEFLKHPACPLIKLKLARADIDDGESVNFIESLEFNKTLTELDMSSNLIGNEEHMNAVNPDLVTGGEALAELLSQKNCALKKVDVSWNTIRLNSALEIGVALAVNRSLVELDLSYNAFASAGGLAVGNSLSSNVTLKKLNLSNNNIPPHAAFVIGTGLRCNRALTEINLGGNPVGAEGGRALLARVIEAEQRQQPVKMNLAQCNFTISDPEAWFSPEEPCGNNGGIFDLDLSRPYDRAVLLELMVLAAMKSGMRFISVSLNGRAVKLAKHIPGRTRPATREENERTRKRAKGMFAQIDTDMSGTVDITELKMALRSLGLPNNDKEAARIMAQYDADGSGTIEMDEFLDFIQQVEDEKRKQDESFMMLQGGAAEPWPVPNSGHAVVKFEHLRLAPRPEMTTKQSVQNLVEQVRSYASDTFTVLELSLSSMHLSAEKGQVLFDELKQETADKAKAMAAVLPRVHGAHHVMVMIDMNLNEAERQRLQQLLGNAFLPIIGLPQGHYKLDLSKPSDRLAVMRIMEANNHAVAARQVSVAEDDPHAMRNYGDTSQKGNWMGFRNEAFSKGLGGEPDREFVLTPDWLNPVPTEGTLEFDYVSTARPHDGTMGVSNRRLRLCLAQLGIHVQESEKALARASSPSMVRRAGMNVSQDRQAMAARDSSYFDEMFATELTRLYADGWSGELTVGNRRASRLTSSRGGPRDGRSSTPPPEEIADASSGGTPVRVEAAAAPAEIVDPMTSAAEGSAATKLQAMQRGKIARRKASMGGLLTGAISGQKLAMKKMAKFTAAGKGHGQRKRLHPQRMLIELQCCLATRWLSVRQGVALLRAYPYRHQWVEVAVLLHARCIDQANYDLILRVLHTKERALLFYRLGWLNLWNPLKPDGWIRLCLGRLEERIVAKQLVHLACVEPGENWLAETFGWTAELPIPGWELTVLWFTEDGFPNKGWLSLVYYSGEGEGLKGCNPDWRLRVAIQSLVLSNTSVSAEDGSIVDAAVWDTSIDPEWRFGDNLATDPSRGDLLDSLAKAKIEWNYHHNYMHVARPWETAGLSDGSDDGSEAGAESDDDPK